MPKKKKGGAAKTDEEVWGEIQKRTFTNWVNDKLGESSHKVVDLAKDLDDGLVLIDLLQSLTGKIIPDRYSGKPTRAAHRNQNLTSVFSFMSEVEHLPIENITPNHIIKHNIREILNLIWLLISRYSITETDIDSKSLLLDWINAALPDKEITNFTSSWRDGVNLLALVNFCRPGLVPDLDSINPDSALDNITQAMQLAKDHFFVPPILIPEDLAVDRPDEHSVMTYLSYFSGPKSCGQRTLFLWLKQKLPDEIEVSNFTTDWVNGYALGGLVDAVSSGGFQEYYQFQETVIESGVQNCQAAMDAAEHLLEVKQTLTAEEFAKPGLNSLRRTAYLIQFYHATRKVNILDVHYPTIAGPGELMWVDISFNGGSLSMVEGFAKGAHIGAVRSEVESLETDKYRVSFEVEHADEYSMSVTVGGVRIKGSPFMFSMIPANPQAVQHINTILPKKVGIPVILMFNVTHAGKGELTAQIMGQSSGPAVTSIDSTSPLSYKVSFIPMQRDVYHVTVMFNDEEIEGSPFELPLNSLIHPESVQLTTPVVEGPGVPVTTSIDLSNAGEGKLEAKCMGDKAGDMDVIVTHHSDHTEISFTPPIEDMYYLSVLFDGTDVLGSPLKIDLYPPPPEAKKVQLTAPPSGALDTGAPITIGFNTADAGVGEMTARCIGKSHGEVLAEVKQTSKHDYEVTFVPPDEDVYEIHVLWSGTPIKGSPFKLDLISKDHPEPSNCKILNMPKGSDLLVTEEEIKFQIDSTDAGKGVLSVTVDIEETETEEATEASASSPDKDKEEDQEVAVEEEEKEDTASQEEVEQKDSSEQPSHSNEKEEPEVKPEAKPPPTPQVVKNSENPSLYDIHYTPNKGGKYTFNVLWAGESIPQSPFTVNVVSPQIAVLGTPVVVNLKTVYKRKHLKAYAISRNGGAQLKVKMEKIASGNYKLVFQPEEPGVYLMHVSTKSKPISGSPFIINYVNAIHPEAVKISGLKQESILGQPMEFVIDAKDAGFGELTVAPLGSMYSQDSAFTTRDADVRSIYLHDNKDGTYSAVFTPESVGNTNLDIRFGGAVVPGSPFQVSVLKKDEEEAEVAEVAATAAAPVKKKGKKGKKSKSGSSLISGLNLESEKFLVGTAHKFKIHCDDLGEGELDVSTKPHTAADVEVTHVADDNAYWVEIIPKKPGKNDILVKFDGKHILGSPFRVQFMSRGDAGKCTLIDTPKECQRELENEVSFCISTKGSGKGKITASVKSISSKTEIPCEVVRPSKHHYHVIFSPTEGLNYLMSVKYDEVHINGSPYKIALGDASLCRVEGEGLNHAWCGKWNQFRIDVEDAGPGELSVSIERDDPDEEIEGMKTEQNISSIDDNHYEVAYQPFFPGNYWITVKWGSINIPGSPFSVTCTQPLKPAQFSVEPITLTHHGKPAHLLVNCDSPIKESDKITVSVHSEKDEKFPGEVQRNEGDQSYTCTVSPPELGKYFVYLLWDGKHIIGSPCEVTNVAPPTSHDFTVEAVEATEGVIAAKVNGPAYAFRYGQLTAAVRMAAGSPEEVPVTVSKNSDEECGVEFKPETGGEYVLGLQYDEEHISGSPFQLISTDASQCYAKGKGIAGAHVNAWNRFSIFTENGGPGELRVEVEGEAEGEGDVLVNTLITAASDTRYNVSYSPTVTGPYRISVLWDIQHIPGSPFNILCCDPNRYTIPKRPNEGVLGKPIRVGVKALTEAPDFEKLEIYAITKDHRKFPGEVQKGADGGYICSVMPPELGKFMLHIQCNSFEINQSPFKVKNYPPPKPDQVLAEGPGLIDGTVGEKGNFSVNVAEGGHGYLSFKVQGPKDGFHINLQRDDEDENKILAEYNPTHCGSYIISLLWSGEHVPDSPFNVTIAEAPPPSVSLNQLEETQADVE